MSDTGKQKKSLFVRISFAVMGSLSTLAALAGLATVITIAIDKVRNGKGLDTYRTASRLVEFNWIEVLVLLAAALAGILIAVALRLRERRQWREFEKTLGRDELP